MFFGGGDPFGRGGGRQRGPRRTKNLVHQLSVTLEDMYNGTVRKLALQKNVICDSCEGITLFRCEGITLLLYYLDCRDNGLIMFIHNLYHVC